MNAQMNHLNGLLADGIVFYQKLRHYHWDVQGEHFFRLHEKFEELYDKFNTINDDIAERMLALGGRPLGTLNEALEESSIKEDPSRPDAPQMVTNLLSDLTQFERSFGDGIRLAEEANDYGTADLLTGFLRDLQKDAWMLRSFLEQERNTKEAAPARASVA